MKIAFRVKMPKKLDILILDENSILRKNQITILKEMGFRGKVFEAGSVESAKKFTDQNNIEFLIISWDILNSNVEEYIKSLRNNESYKNVPIMILAKQSDIGEMLRALGSGASSYTVKPIDIKQYIDSFQSAYEKHYDETYLKKYKNQDS